MLAGALQIASLSACGMRTVESFELGHPSPLWNYLELGLNFIVAEALSTVVHSKVLFFLLIWMQFSFYGFDFTSAVKQYLIEESWICLISL